MKDVSCKKYPEFNLDSRATGLLPTDYLPVETMIALGALVLGVQNSRTWFKRGKTLVVGLTDPECQNTRQFTSAAVAQNGARSDIGEIRFLRLNPEQFQSFLAETVLNPARTASFSK